MFDVTTCTWSRPADSGEIPAPRTGHSAVNANGRVYVFAGGNEHGEVYNDLHILDTLFFRTDTYLSKAGSSAAMSPRARRSRKVSADASSISSARGVTAERPETSANDEFDFPDSPNANMSNLTLERGQYFMNQLDSMSDRVKQMMEGVESDISEQRKIQQIREQQYIAYIKTMERQHHLEVQKLASTLVDLQNIVITDLADLRNDFLACISRDKTMDLPKDASVKSARIPPNDGEHNATQAASHSSRATNAGYRGTASPPSLSSLEYRPQRQWRERLRTKEEIKAAAIAAGAAETPPKKSSAKKRTKREKKRDALLAKTKARKKQEKKMWADAAGSIDFSQSTLPTVPTLQSPLANIKLETSRRETT